jgi:prepilin-type N-terminal cleavage/methylation domain-containing protein
VDERTGRADAGFTLIEVLAAMLLIAAAAIGVAGLLGAAVRSRDAARVQTMATLLAQQKMEQILSLTWRFDPAGTGLPDGDTTSDVSFNPPQAGGTGLQPSPAGTLDADTSGFVDYLDATGRWVGRAGAVPGAAVYVRRWSIQSLASDPADTRVVQVLVRPVGRALPGGEVVLTALKTRRAA